MVVYIDDYNAKYGRMVMCHMIADTDEELHAMAGCIGVQRKWFQKAGTAGRHYDICLSKKAKAVAAGAVEITAKQAASMCAHRRVFGNMGTPEQAYEWRKSWRKVNE